jgi:hypothetical protein
MLNLPITNGHRGYQLRLIVPGAQLAKPGPVERDEKLVQLLGEAHCARQLVLSQPDQAIAAIASAHGRCWTSLGRLVALSASRLTSSPPLSKAGIPHRQPLAR